MGCGCVWRITRKAIVRFDEGNRAGIATVTFLHSIWMSWRAFNRMMANYQSRIVLTLLYYSLFAPLAMIVRVSSSSKRMDSTKGESFWIARPARNSDLASLRRQF